MSKYTVGGAVQAGGGIYIERAADREMLEACLDGEFAYVLTTRQVGKSSLMVRTAEELRKRGTAPVIIDLTQIGTQVTAEQWHVGLLAQIEEQLELETDAIAWWQSNGQIGITQRLTRFFEEVVFQEFPGRVVVFVDEIDTTLSLPFTDDFFTLIRHFYNERAIDKRYKRLSFVLIGVATPADLVKDPHRTPFNVGRGIELIDFSFEEAEPLTAGLQLDPERARQVLRSILEWTGGHPFLTVRLCDAFVREGGEAGVDDLVRRTFFSGDLSRDNNIQFVRDMLTVRTGIHQQAILRLYRGVLQKGTVPDQKQSHAHAQLKLSGVVRARNGALVSRNRIYRELFDLDWIRRHLLVNWRKRLFWAAAAAAALFLLAIVPLAWIAFQERNQALTRYLAAQAVLLQDGEPDQLPRSVLLAIESMRATPNIEAYQSLYRALSILPPWLGRLEHGNEVHRAEYSPDGRYLATGGDFYVWVWESKSQRLVFRARHRGTLHAMKWTSPGTLAAVSSAKNLAEERGYDIRLWHTGNAEISQEGKAPDQLAPHCRAGALGSVTGALVEASPSWLVLEVSLGSDVQTIPSIGDPVSSENEIQAWNWSDERTLCRSASATWSHRIEAGANAVLVHPVLPLAVTSHSRGVARLWNLSNGQIEQLLPHPAPVNHAALSMDAQWIATASDDHLVRLWRRGETGVPIEMRHEEAVRLVEFAPASPVLTLATATAQGQVVLWREAPSPSPSGVMEKIATFAHNQPVERLRFSPLNPPPFLATVSTDDTARLWDLRRMSESGRMVHRRDVVDAAFSPGGATIVTASRDSAASLWSARAGADLLPGRMPDTFETPGTDLTAVQVAADLHGAAGLYAVALYRPPAGLVVTSSRAPCRIVIGSLAGGDPHWADWGQRPTSIRFSPDASLVAIGDESGTAALFESKTLRLKQRFAHEGRVHSVAISAAQDLIAVGGATSVTVWPIGGKKPVALFRAGDPVTALEFAPDSHKLAFATGSRVVLLADATDPDTGPLAAVHGGPVNDLAFSRAGPLLASASNDNTVRLWNGNSAQPSGAPILFDTDVRSLDFLPDGSHLIAQSGDLLRLFRIRNREEIGRIPGVSGVLPARFSSRGKEVFYLQSDRYFRSASWMPSDLIQTACNERLNRNLSPEEWNRYMHIGVLSGFFRFLFGDRYRRTCPSIGGDPAFAFSLYHQALGYAEAGDDLQARAAFEELADMAADFHDPALLNTLCWDGSLWGHAATVLDLCNRAIAAEPENGNFHDSRGIAQALLRRNAEARKDFEIYLAWVGDRHDPAVIARRKDWVERLKQPSFQFKMDPGLRRTLLEE